MLTAKLFAGLAILVTILGFALGAAGNHSIDIYIHDAYFVVADLYLQLFVCFVCLIFAVAYFALARWTPRPANQRLGLASVILIALSFPVWLPLSLFTWPHRPPHSWQPYVMIVGLFSFLFGAALSAGNLAWALVWTLPRTVRGHFRKNTSSH